MANGKVFCNACKFMKDFAIHVPKLVAKQDFICLRFPETKVTALEECEVFGRCTDRNENNDCGGFKQVSKLAAFFRTKPR